MKFVRRMVNTLRLSGITATVTVLVQLVCLFIAVVYGDVVVQIFTVVWVVL